MAHDDKKVNFQSTNTYATLFQKGQETQYVWFVFHGMGYLSRYFLKYFKELPSHLHYIIAPQAPSKYYLNDRYTHVGASWLTKEETKSEIENNYAYLDAVWQKEEIGENAQLIFLGFSQGASIALRWLVKRKFRIAHLIIYAGGIPQEITADDVAFLIPHTRISIVYGSDDHYLTPDRIARQQEKIDELFGEHARIVNFEGGHEIKMEVLQGILEEDQ